MKKLSVEEQKKVIGGYDDGMCGVIQRLATDLVNSHCHNDHTWDTWCKMFDMYCI